MKKYFMQSYFIWIVMGLFFAMLILVIVLFASDYQQNAILGRLWEAEFGGLPICR